MSEGFTQTGNVQHVAASRLSGLDQLESHDYRVAACVPRTPLSLLDHRIVEHR